MVVVRRQLGSVNSSLTWRINDCASWLLDPPHDYTPPTPTHDPVHLPSPHLPRRPAVHGPPVMGGEALQEWQDVLASRQHLACTCMGLHSL